jgi:Zn-finger nucleic acid-binding protein
MQSCPRCQSVLNHSNTEATCPQGHGVLWTLSDFKGHTDKPFAQWFFANWLRLGNKRSIPCPQCKTRMIQMNVDENATVELDCCPSCFSLWLDWGEDQAIQKIFIQQDQRSDANLSEMYSALGKELLKHDKIKQRFSAMDRLGRRLQRRVHFFNRHRIFFDFFKD